MWYDGYGTLYYSPHKEGITKDSKWWLIVQCDEVIGQYYRRLCWYGLSKTRPIQTPAWKTHISVICDEIPPVEYRDLWKKYNGNIVKYQYKGVVKSNGIYFWLPVICEQLLNIREELGLVRNPHIPLHMTIGNLKNDI